MRAPSIVDGDVTVFDSNAILLYLAQKTDEINARPAAIRASALKERFQFKSEWDDEARRFMFPFLAH